MLHIPYFQGWGEGYGRYLECTEAMGDVCCVPIIIAALADLIVK